MASPAEITSNLPDTLPADFSDWDGKASSAAAPSAPAAFEPTRTSGAAPKPVAKFAALEAILTPQREVPFVPVVDRSRNARSPLSAPVFADDDAFLQAQQATRRFSGRDPETVRQKQKKLNTLVDKLPSNAPPRREAIVVAPLPLEPILPQPAAPTVLRNGLERMSSVMPQVADGPFKAFGATLDTEEVPAPRKKKWIVVSAICATPALLLLFFVLPHFHAASQPQFIDPPSAAADTQPQPDTPEPSPRESSTHSKPLASDATRPETQNQQDQNQQANNQQARPTQVQTEMMSDQLAAPTRIPKGVNKQVADNAPPAANIGTEGLSGGSAAMGNAFNGQSQPSVRVERLKSFTLSAGVANGRLIYQATPNYPPLAKQSHVSGTVVMQAVISETGTIKDLHVTNGPVILREAALDAVRTWRYKPYTLNNQPIEVHTTISVIFALNQ